MQRREVDERQQSATMPALSIISPVSRAFFKPRAENDEGRFDYDQRFTDDDPRLPVSGESS